LGFGPIGSGCCFGFCLFKALEDTRIFLSQN
jgi:hypothetical protein